MKLGNIEIVMSMDGVEQSMNLIFVQKYNRVENYLSTGLS